MPFIFIKSDMDMRKGDTNLVESKDKVKVIQPYVPLSLISVISVYIHHVV